MVNFPPEPNEPQSDSPGTGPYRVSFDEGVALLVAFLSVSAILLWGFTRDGGWRSLTPATVTDAIGDAVESESLDQPIMADPEASLDVEPDGTDSLRRPADLRDSGQVEGPETGREIMGFRSPDGSQIAAQLRTMTGLVGLNAESPAVETPESAAPADGSTPGTAAAPTSVESPEPEGPATTATAPLTIDDVPEDYWAYPFISGLYEQGLLPDFPSGQFEPETALTRADLAALINQAFLGNVSAPSADFSDVSADYWAAEAIANAVAANFMSGYPEGDFRPDQPVPRYQVLVTLASGLGLRPVNDPQATLQQFEDRAALPAWAQTQVAAATESGLVVNHPYRAQMQPQETATRAEIVAMIYQALAETGQVAPISSQYVISGSQ
ncbi:hypothetical protein C7271_03535 [filamentous cyanobacterium CCP5]|nr:hypothetical protein C7271_03535 [filamentous cyanobacterium CCP5]